MKNGVTGKALLLYVILTLAQLVMSLCADGFVAAGKCLFVMVIFCPCIVLLGSMSDGSKPSLFKILTAALCLAMTVLVPAGYFLGAFNVLVSHGILTCLAFYAALWLFIVMLVFLKNLFND